MRTETRLCVAVVSYILCNLFFSFVSFAQQNRKKKKAKAEKEFWDLELSLDCFKAATAIYLWIKSESEFNRKTSLKERRWQEQVGSVLFCPVYCSRASKLSRQSIWPVYMDTRDMRCRKEVVSSNWKRQLS